MLRFNSIIVSFFTIAMSFACINQTFAQVPTKKDSVIKSNVAVPVKSLKNLPDRIYVSDYKEIMEITEGKGSFTANVYFTGSGFPHAVTGSVNGGSFQSLIFYLQKCTKGSRFTVESIVLKQPNGTQTKIPNKNFFFK